MSIDLASLPSAISADAPCGDDLEYDPAFVELERLVAGKPEQQIGDTVLEAEGPDWNAVRKQAMELLGRTKDLRVVVHLTRALLNTEGYVDLQDGLELLRSLLENHWESVHPQLDPSDGLDPTMRVNILAALCDPETMLREVREAPLVSSKTIGRFSLRDIHIATGVMEAEDAAADMSAIEAAFADADIEGLKETAEALKGASQHLNAMEEFLTGQLGTGTAPSFRDLTGLLQEAHKILSEQLARRGVNDGAASAEGQEAPSEVSAAAQPAGAPLTGEIRSREDVARALDKICAYYRRNEPSSPVPLLMARAKRLISMDFVEIVRDMAPDGLAQVDTIRGSSSEDSG